MRLAVSGGQLLFTYVCYIPSRLPVFAVGPEYQYLFLICVKRIVWRTHTIFKQIHVCLKLEWSLYDRYWLSRELLRFEVFFSCPFSILLWVTYTNMLVATQWPLKYAPNLTSLVCAYKGASIYFQWITGYSICHCGKCFRSTTRYTLCTFCHSFYAWSSTLKEPKKYHES